MARYIGRHGTSRVAKAVLLGAVPPLILKTDASPKGLPMKVFDDIRAGSRGDRSQFFKDLALPFFGFNRKGAKVSYGLVDALWFRACRAASRESAIASSSSRKRTSRRTSGSSTCRR